MSATANHVPSMGWVLVAAVFVLIVDLLADINVRAFAEPFHNGRSPLPRRLVAAARHESRRLLGGVPALAMTTIASLLGADTAFAVNLALWLTVAELGAVGYLSARYVGLSPRTAFGTPRRSSAWSWWWPRPSCTESARSAGADQRSAPGVVREIIRQVEREVLRQAIDGHVAGRVHRDGDGGLADPQALHRERTEGLRRRWAHLHSPARHVDRAPAADPVAVLGRAARRAVPRDGHRRHSPSRGRCRVQHGPCPRHRSAHPERGPAGHRHARGLDDAG